MIQLDIIEPLYCYTKTLQEAFGVTEHEVINKQRKKKTTVTKQKIYHS
jgi:hypothetical protein